MSKEPFTSQEINALRTFADYHGPRWKSKLRESWERSYYDGMPEHVYSILQALRHRSTFGPAGLNRFRFPTPSPEQHTVELLIVRRVIVEEYDEIQAERAALATLSPGERAKVVCMRVYEGNPRSEVDWPDVGDGWYSPPPS